MPETTFARGACLRGLLVALLVCNLFILFGARCAAAEPALAEIFGNGMVLQRDKPIPVWGSAEDGSEITVAFGGASVTGKASDGKWMVELPAQKANSQPQQMTVSFKGGKSIVIEDVLVGEVWLCAGQSNMDQRISKRPPRELADMPLVRQFARGRGAGSKNPPSWAAAVAKNQTEMSMTAIYFAENLFRELGVPVGLILTAVSGTPIESWIPKATLEADPEIKPLLDALEDRATRQKLVEANMGRRNNPSEPADPQLSKLATLGEAGSLYARHIEPTTPFAIRGVLWYQGEANTSREANARMYGDYLRMLVESLRAEYNQPALPFYIVQLPSIEEPRKEGGPRSYEIVREQQRLFVRNTPQTALAVTIDIHEGLHPRSKHIIGDRLARIALADVYGNQGSQPAAGPQLKSVVFEGNRAICSFDHSEGGLQLKGTKESLFELAGEDGKFQPATAVVEGEKLVVTSDKVREAKAVRYAYKPFMPEVALFGAGDLPVSPFVNP